MPDPTHRVVFELASAAPESWSAALNNVENLRKALGDGTRVAVVAHGKGIGLYLDADDALAARVRTLLAQGVELCACANTLRRLGVAPEALPAGVRVVDSGVAEVVRRQEQGWTYLRSG